MKLQKRLYKDLCRRVQKRFEKGSIVQGTTRFLSGVYKSLYGALFRSQGFWGTILI